MAIEDVTALARRWRTAGGSMERVRVMAEAARTLGGLTRDERRMLARGLAERGAPDLADRLARRTGGALSGSELTDAARQLLSLDAQTLGDLGQSLRDPDERRRLLDAAVPATAPEPEEPEPGPEARHVEPEAEVETPPEVEADAGPADEADAGPADEAAVREPEDLDPDVRFAPEVVVTPDLLVEPRVAEPGLPPATLRTVDVAAVVTTIVAATTAHDRITAVADLAGQPLDGAELRQVLTALPDGWQRRRAATRLVPGTSLSAEDAGRIVTSLARDSDRIAVAAALVGADPTLLDVVRDALPERAADRLARRVPPVPRTA